MVIFERGGVAQPQAPGRHGKTKLMSDTQDRKACAAGEYFFHEGDRADCAYVIQSGKVEIVKTIDGKENVLGVIGPGGIFGVLALIVENPRMASARAVEGTMAFVVSRMRFNAKLDKADPFIRGLLHILTETIRSTTSKL